MKIRGKMDRGKMDMVRGKMDMSILPHFTTMDKKGVRLAPLTPRPALSLIHETARNKTATMQPVIDLDEQPTIVHGLFQKFMPRY
jgi:hypothetical protein